MRTAVHWNAHRPDRRLRLASIGLALLLPIRPGAAALDPLGVACALLAGCATYAPPTDPLPSWNEGAARQSIVAFVDEPIAIVVNAIVWNFGC